MSSTATTLDQPLALRSGLVLPNRLAKAAMTENLADGDNQPTARLERLYATWADGGAGLLLTGNLMVDRRYLERSRNVVADGLVDPARLAAWADEGQLKPTVSATFAFDEAGVRGAFEALRSRRTAGKVVIDVSASAA